MEVNGPNEIDAGYWELRLNWTSKDLMAMTPSDYKAFRELLEAIGLFVGDFQADQDGT